MSQVDTIAHRRTIAVLSIWIAVVICMEFFNWTHRVRPDQQGVVRGQLVEWSEIHLSKGGITPRFMIRGSRSDFRIDPMIYDGVMKRQIPADFAPGVKVEITASAAQLASPYHPLLNQSVSIVWVNGLSVNGRRQFDVSDVVENEKRNSLWLLALIGVPLALLGYLTMSWRRGQKHPTD